MVNHNVDTEQLEQIILTNAKLALEGLKVVYGKFPYRNMDIDNILKLIDGDLKNRGA